MPKPDVHPDEKSRRPWFLCLALLAALLAVEGAAAAWLLTLFSRPAGWLASWALGCPAVWIPGEGLRLLISEGEVLVNHGCSGFGFFTILLILVTWYRPRRLPVMLVPVYLLTLVINAARIVLAVYAQVFTVRFWMPELGPAVHLVAGVAIFLPALLIFSVLLERSRPHDLPA